jgi:hypothetical protein
MRNQPDRPAGFDRPKLLVITHQPYIGAAAQAIADDRVQGAGARHGGLVNDQYVPGAEVELVLGEAELTHIVVHTGSLPSSSSPTPFGSPIA